MSSHKWRTTGGRIAAAAVISGSALMSATSPASAATGPHGTLVLGLGYVTPFSDNFNPFSPSSEQPTQGAVYEPLWFYDTANVAVSHPWLATSYAWSNSGKTITFTLRHNVKWTDGVPFTSADVAFTFNLIKSNPALNESALPITDAVAEGPYKVAVHFSKPSYADVYFIAGTTYIVPEHIWKSVKDPATWTDPKGIGTGPYEVGSVGQTMVMRANPHYYMPGLPKFETLKYLYFNGNTSLDLAIESGEIGFGGAFIPNIKQAYEAKSKYYHVTNIPGAIINIVPNMVSGPTTSLAVREAVSDAINRKFVTQNVYDGLVGQINQTALLQPVYSGVTDPALDKPYIFSDAAAKHTLQAAGYKLGSNGYFEKNGHELTLTAQVPSGYTDYVSDLQIISQEAKAAGINLVVDAESLSEYASNRANGNFQLLIEYYGFTPSPYVYYKNLLDSQGVPGMGKLDSVGDYGRYSNSELNNLLDDIAATPDVAVQKPDFYKIEAIVANQLPAIPVSNQQADAEYNGKDVTGYPTAQNPYANGLAPDSGWILARLAPVG